ncbi:hypothetical protein PHISP_04186 [Aspergillus sp. HF37]|nr:hypothetical protein PHISP_04186 [Aspergillus sp. HF37]
MKILRLLRNTPNISQLPTYAHLRSPPVAVTPAVLRQMTMKASLPHEERTAAEPRQNRLYSVRLSHIDQANPTVRLLQLAIPPPSSEESRDDSRGDEQSDQEQPFTFLPGQWLDVHIPFVTKAGGFSITSTPADARVLPSPESTEALGTEEPGIAEMETRGRRPYVELAVQEAPSNPAGAWLWKPQDEILGKELCIRVGGSFVWPPPSGINVREIRNVVLIAGGMGINPLISILSHLNNNDPSFPIPPSSLNINILYTTRLPKGLSATEAPPETILDQILFLPRLRQIMRAQSHARRLRISVELFITDLPEHSPLVAAPPPDLIIHSRRIKRQDLQAAVVGEDALVNPKDSVCYLCGPPRMTDEFVDEMRGLLGGETERVLFEKWW